MRRSGRPSVISVCFYSACPKLEKSQCWGCQGWHPTQVSPLGHRASLLSHWCLSYRLWVCRGFSDHLTFWDTFPGEIAQSPIPLRRVSCPKLLLAPCVCCQQDLWAGAAVFGRVLHVAATPCLGGASPGWFCLCTVRVPQRELCHLCEDLELNRTTPLQG